MARQRRSSKAAVTVGALILASITIITVNARGGTGAIGGVRGLVGEITSPVFSAVDAVVSPVGNLLAGTINYGRVQRENEQLRAALARLETQAALNSTAAQQLAQLMALEHLPYLGTLPLVTAQTIDVNRSNFEATITLNKGRSSGILVGMPVVSSAGLVGAVVAVSNATATVRLITDASSSVSVDGSSNPADAGIAQGQGPGKNLDVSFLPAGVSVQRGQLFSTSGLQGGLFPGGIPVGTVTSRSSVAGSGSVGVTLQPVVDLSNLAYVDVVQWEATS